MGDVVPLRPWRGEPKPCEVCGHPLYTRDKSRTVHYACRPGELKRRVVPPTLFDPPPEP